MTTTDSTTGNLKINFYTSLSQFSAQGTPKADELHLSPTSSIVSYYHANDMSAWYYVWSDGHIEQGGKATNVPTSGTKAVLLPMPYSNTNYAIFLTISSFTQIVLPRITSKSSSSFDLDFQGGGLAGDVFWYAIGN